MDLYNLFLLVLLTMVPVFELRWSIPVGLWSKAVELPFLGEVSGLGLPLFEVLPVVIVSNILLGVVLFLLLGRLVRLFTRVQFIKELYNAIVERTQRKAQKYVERYGTVGLALFIAVPLPGSGVWTGALAAYLLGVRFRSFVLAEIFGVLVAAAIVTAVVLGFLNGF